MYSFLSITILEMISHNISEVPPPIGPSLLSRYNLAMVYRDDERLKEAAAELKRVVELDRLVSYPGLESDTAMLAEVEAELNGS